MMIRVIALFKSYFFLKVCYYNVFFSLSFYSVHKDTNKILHREVGFLRIKPGTNQVAFISSHNNGIKKILWRHNIFFYIISIHKVDWYYSARCQWDGWGDGGGSECRPGIAHSRTHVFRKRSSDKEGYCFYNFW